MDIDQYLYDQLIDALRLAAAPVEVQQDVLPDFVHVPDEVLLAFEPSSIPQLESSGRLSSKLAKRLRDYDAYLETYTASESYEDQMRDLADGGWFAKLRLLARELLSELNEGYQAPKLEGVHYVPGGESGDR